MRKYVILTYSILVVGGTQAYTAGRTKWLESKGWKTWVFFEDSRDGVCEIPYLGKYLNGRFPMLPLPYRIDDSFREEILNKMVNIIDYQIGDEVIIESHDDYFSYWGELFAESVQGRHYFFSCNEVYRPYAGERCTYVDNLDFFRFKYLRKELIATKESLNRLFNGYKGIKDPLVEYPSICMEQDMVQDVENDEVDDIVCADWNIALIGRPEKRYVEYVVTELFDFVSKKIEKKINIIIVGNMERAPRIRQLFTELFYGLENVDVIYLGVLSPIPRALFKKVDVVIAAAQTAQLASYEDVYVIAANVSSNTTPGVLGYDTQDSWFGGNLPGKKYSDVLEDVLVFGKYYDRNFCMPDYHDADYYYEEQWPYLELAEKKLEYYTDKFKQNLRRDYMVVFPFWRVKQQSNVLIYGAGMVGQDYLKQAGNYCNVVGVIDANAEKFDDMVMFPDEGLRKTNYDYVVLAAFDSSIAISMKQKTLEYFVDENRIVYEIVRAYL